MNVPIPIQNVEMDYSVLESKTFVMDGKIAKTVLMKSQTFVEVREYYFILFILFRPLLCFLDPKYLKLFSFPVSDSE